MRGRWRVAARLFAALSVTVVFGSLVSVGTASARRLPEWSVVASPDNSSGSSILNAVSCTGADFCMAVGGSSSDGEAPLIEEWDGSEWSVAASPAVTQLSGVSCASDMFCMAVGDSASGTAVYEWDGTGWTSVADAAPASSYLNGVSCVSADFCVAVGSQPFEGVASAPQIFAEQWDGSEWSVVPLTNPDLFNLLDSVSCSSSESCYAVGANYTTDCTGKTTCTAVSPEPFVEQFDGSSWQDWTPTITQQGGTLASVSCTSATSCAAVGTTNSYKCKHGTQCRDYGFKSLFESGDGSAWTEVTNGVTGTRTVPDGVSCTSSSDCTAVGRDHSHALIELWNGAEWEHVAPPKLGGSTSQVLDGISCVGTSTCIAVGGSSNGTTEETLVESWNGP